MQVVKDFAGNRDDTLIIVVPDHAHPASIIGTYDDDKPGQLLRDKLGIYADAGFPSYPTANASGYPTGVDAQRRLAFVFAAAPDHCATGRPALDGEFQPVVPGPDGKTFRANEKYCTPNAVRVTGNLPFTANSGVHSGEDVIATAMGPGAELVRGHMHNTAIFRVMAIALGLAK